MVKSSTYVILLITLLAGATRSASSTGSAPTFFTNNNKSARQRVLRGYKKKNDEGGKKADGGGRKTARNEPKQSKPKGGQAREGGKTNRDRNRSSSDRSSDNDNSKAKVQGQKRQYEPHYNYFSEACQSELISDVINGGIIQHKEYSAFVYGFCRKSSQKGPQCSQHKENEGFHGMTNDLKLMYIKSFCPEDVDGQVSCLHGMNDRGREYEFKDEMVRLCKDLESLMYKNELLVKDKPAEEEFFTHQQLGGTHSQPGGDLLQHQDNHGGQQDTVSGYEAIGSYQSNQNNADKNDFTVSFVGQTDSAQEAPKIPATPSPTTRRPTRSPTPRPTPKRGPPRENDEAPAPPPLQPPPWEQPTNTNAQDNGPYGNYGILEDTDAHRGTGNPFPTPAPTPRPPLMVVDKWGNPILPDDKLGQETDINVVKNKKDKDGITAGGIVAIILIVILAMTIVVSGYLLCRKWHRLHHSHSQRGGGRFIDRGIPGIFFMNMRKIKPTDGLTTVAESATHDKTYLEEEEQGRSREGSIGSEEIDFHGPLFDSWPAVAPVTVDEQESLPEEDDDQLIDTSSPQPNYDNNDNEEYDEDQTDSPSTFTSSLLSSFFSRAKRGQAEAEAPSTDNAVDEIQRAINDAQWQEVYYLASKMASGGNIDTNENLQSALVKSSNESQPQQPPDRSHLKPEDAARADQLDVSMAAGDFITLAARAAVFAALQSANNPVPTSISFSQGDEDGTGNAEDCLERAQKALEELEKAEAERLARQQAAAELESVAERTEFTSTENDDKDEDTFEYSYPKDDYSDFTPTSNAAEDDSSSCNTSRVSSRREIPIGPTYPGGPPAPLMYPATPTLQNPSPPMPACVEEVESDSDSDSDSSSDSLHLDDDDQSDSSATRSSLPGPPSIAMSNQSTIPTKASVRGTVPFATIEDTARGPFQRDFDDEFGISHMIIPQGDAMDQSPKSDL